jgi:hypothetical protein
MFGNQDLRRAARHSHDGHGSFLVSGELHEAERAYGYGVHLEPLSRQGFQRGSENVVRNRGDLNSDLAAFAAVFDERVGDLIRRQRKFLLYLEPDHLDDLFGAPLGNFEFAKDRP